MPTTPESLLYQVADILQLPLHRVDKGYKAVNATDIQIGPWSVATDIRVKSDTLTKDHAAFWVFINRNLWLYVVSYGRGEQAKMIVFDGSIAKLSKGLLQTPCETNNDLKATLARLREAGGIAYAYDKETGWKSSTVDIA